MMMFGIDSTGNSYIKEEVASLANWHIIYTYSVDTAQLAVGLHTGSRV